MNFANKFVKFHAKRLNRSKNIPKEFLRGYFFETPCILIKTKEKVVPCKSNLAPCPIARCCHVKNV